VKCEDFEKTVVIKKNIKEFINHYDKYVARKGYLPRTLLRALFTLLSLPLP